MQFKSLCVREQDDAARRHRKNRLNLHVQKHGFFVSKVIPKNIFSDQPGGPIQKFGSIRKSVVNTNSVKTVRDEFLSTGVGIWRCESSRAEDNDNVQKHATAIRRSFATVA